MFCAQMRGEIRFTWHVAYLFRFFLDGSVERQTVVVGFVRGLRYKPETGILEVIQCWCFSFDFPIFSFNIVFFLPPWSVFWRRSCEGNLYVSKRMCGCNTNTRSAHVWACPENTASNSLKLVLV